MLGTWSACNTSSSGIPMVDGREDFEAFYTKFYEDSIFQYQRTEFPLSGLDSEGKPKVWMEENWVVQKPLNLDDKDIQRIVEAQPEFIRERVIFQNAFLAERYYSYDTQNKRWMLTYYADMHLPQTTAERSSTRGGAAESDSIPSDQPENINNENE